MTLVGTGHASNRPEPKAGPARRSQHEKVWQAAPAGWQAAGQAVVVQAQQGELRKGPRAAPRGREAAAELVVIQVSERGGGGRVGGKVGDQGGERGMQGCLPAMSLLWGRRAGVSTCQMVLRGCKCAVRITSQRRQRQEVVGRCARGLASATQLAGRASAESLARHSSDALLQLLRQERQRDKRARSPPEDRQAPSQVLQRLQRPRGAPLERQRAPQLVALQVDGRHRRQVGQRRRQRAGSGHGAVVALQGSAQGGPRQRVRDVPAGGQHVGRMRARQRVTGRAA